MAHGISPADSIEGIFRKQPAEEPVRMVVLDTGEFVFRFPSKEVQTAGRLDLEGSTSPKRLDLRTLVVPSGKPFTDLALYELKDGTLTIAKGPPGGARAASFEPSTTSVVQRWRRVDD